MSYFIEDSTLGVLIENNKTEDGKYLFDTKYEELTRREKIKAYLLLGVTRTLVSLTIISAIIWVMVIIKGIIWYQTHEDVSPEYNSAFLELTGYELTVWWVMLIEYLGWFCLVLVITIPIKTIRLIVSFIYYRKRL